MNVIKRNGSEVPFDVEKIKISVTKANNSIEESDRIDEDTINFICKFDNIRCRLILFQF